MIFKDTQICRWCKHPKINPIIANKSCFDPSESLYQCGSGVIDGIPGECFDSSKMQEGSIDCFDRSDEKVFSKNAQTTFSQIEDDFNFWKDKPCFIDSARCQGWKSGECGYIRSTYSKSSYSSSEVKCSMYKCVSVYPQDIAMKPIVTWMTDVRTEAIFTGYQLPMSLSKNLATIRCHHQVNTDVKLNGIFAKVPTNVSHVQLGVIYIPIQHVMMVRMRQTALRSTNRKASYQNQLISNVIVHSIMMVMTICYIELKLLPREIKLNPTE